MGCVRAGGEGTVAGSLEPGVCSKRQGLLAVSSSSSSSSVKGLQTPRVEDGSGSGSRKGSKELNRLLSLLTPLRKYLTQ